jgi:hypothetical protein
MSRRIALGLTLVLLSVTADGWSQGRGGRAGGGRAGGGTSERTNVNIGGGFGGGFVPFYGGGGWGASTAAQGYGYGMAAVIQAAGQANLMDSIAAGNYEDARSKLIDNRLKWTNTYFEMRQQNEAARRAMRAPPLSHEAAVRIAREKAPRRPTNSQLDPVTGTIAWPLALQNPIYDENRKVLDAAFAERAANSGSIGFATFQKIEDACSAFLAKLQDNIKDFRPQDYTIARNFVTGLCFEARFPEE